MKTHYNVENPPLQYAACNQRRSNTNRRHPLTLTTDQRKVNCARCLAWLGMDETDARHRKNNPEAQPGYTHPLSTPK